MTNLYIFSTSPGIPELESRNWFDGERRSSLHNRVKCLMIFLLFCTGPSKKRPTHRKSRIWTGTWTELNWYMNWTELVHKLNWTGTWTELSWYMNWTELVHKLNWTGTCTELNWYMNWTELVHKLNWTGTWTELSWYMNWTELVHELNWTCTWIVWIHGLTT